MKTYTVTVNGEEFLIGIEGRKVVAVNGQECGPVSVEQTAQHQYSVLLGGTVVTVAASGTSGGVEAFAEARLHRVQVASERERFRKRLGVASKAPARMEVRAPMPALVVKVEVSEGEDVLEGDGLLVLEAMKMENEIRAHAAGKVKKVLVTAGAAVEKDQLLILLE